MHLPYTAPYDLISDARDDRRQMMTDLRRAFGSGLSKFLNWSCTSWHCVVVNVILSMAEEEDRCAHRVKARREQSHGLPSRSTTRARNKQQASARASPVDTIDTTLRRETLGNPCKSLFQVAFSPICDSRIQTSPSDNTHHMQPYAS